MTTAADQLAQWLERTHPQLFDALYTHVQDLRTSGMMNRARLRGFGQDDGSDTEFVVDVPNTAVDITPYQLDLPTLTSTDLQSPAMSAAISAPDVNSALDVSTDNSGTGFLQSIGSGISTAASSVANYLTSSQGLAALTNLGTAFFQAQNSATNAKLQSQVLQAQISRAQTGASPSPVSYASLNGQLVPIYASNLLPTVGGAIVAPGNMPASLVSAISTGQSQFVTLPDGTTGYVIPPNTVSSLSGNLTFQNVLPWILLIGGGLILVKALR